jgi:AraC-like DNA-binding protein
VRGVAITDLRRRTDFGIDEVVYELRWLTEPGWVTLEVEIPTLVVMGSETGGHCEFRQAAERPAEGEYYGDGALAFVTGGSRISIHAAEIREARLCCFGLHAADAEFLAPGERGVVGSLPSRFMFQNRELKACASLLDADRARGGSGRVYLRSLSKTLYAAVLGLADAANDESPRRVLSGTQWGTVSRYIRDHSTEHITIEALADIVPMPPDLFGEIFRAVTGMSVRKWQMDDRVRAAQRLLTDNPHESLADVARLCGFADQSHFSRAFLEVIGLTPTAWLHSRA